MSGDTAVGSASNAPSVSAESNSDVAEEKAVKVNLDGRGCEILKFIGLEMEVLTSKTATGRFVVSENSCQSTALAILNPSISFCPTIGPPDWLVPGNLGHAISDEELLWRASIVPQRTGLPIARTPKIAFMFLTKGPITLAPIWEKYFKGQKDLYSVYVHATPGFRLEVSSSSVFYGRQIPSQETRWGEISVSDAERRLLANALLDFSSAQALQPFGVLHGGTTAYIAESIASFAGAYASNFQRVAGIELNVNHLRPAPVGSEVTVTASPFLLGSRLQVWEVKFETERPKKSGGESKASSSELVLVAVARVTLIVGVPQKESEASKVSIPELSGLGHLNLKD